MIFKEKDDERFNKNDAPQKYSDYWRKPKT